MKDDPYKRVDGEEYLQKMMRTREGCDLPIITTILFPCWWTGVPRVFMSMVFGRGFGGVCLAVAYMQIRVRSC